MLTEDALKNRHLNFKRTLKKEAEKDGLQVNGTYIKRLNWMHVVYAIDKRAIGFIEIRGTEVNVTSANETALKENGMLQYDISESDTEHLISITSEAIKVIVQYDNAFQGAPVL